MANTPVSPAIPYAPSPELLKALSNPRGNVTPPAAAVRVVSSTPVAALCAVSATPTARFSPILFGGSGTDPRAVVFTDELGALPLRAQIAIAAKFPRPEARRANPGAQ